MKISVAYFSGTGTTKKIIMEIGRSMSSELKTYDLARHLPSEDICIPSDEVLLVGMPVYAGRVPVVAAHALQRFKGTHTPVILVAVYGNREFDDIFVEMQDIFESNGFFVIAGGAFIAQHSIFPHTAEGRPDVADLQMVHTFAERCKQLVSTKFSAEATSIHLPGNRPYKVPGNIPLKMTTDSNCTACGACISVCPVGAIPLDNPKKTDYEKCIHCGKCMTVCNAHARHYGGLLYNVVGAIFGWKNRVRKSPEFFF